MSVTKSYSVPGMHCGQCKAAVTNELKDVVGVEGWPSISTASW